MALLGNTPDAYGRTWHLPVAPDRLTYAEMIGVAEEVTGRRIGHTVLPSLAFTVGGRFAAPLREVQELLPRYRGDNLFESADFDARFPDFEVTTYRDGIRRLVG